MALKNETLVFANVPKTYPKKWGICVHLFANVPKMGTFAMGTFAAPYCRLQKSKKAKSSESFGSKLSVASKVPVGDVIAIFQTCMRAPFPSRGILSLASIELSTTTVRAAQNDFASNCKKATLRVRLGTNFQHQTHLLPGPAKGRKLPIIHSI